MLSLREGTFFFDGEAISKKPHVGCIMKHVQSFWGNWDKKTISHRLRENYRVVSRKGKFRRSCWSHLFIRSWMLQSKARLRRTSPCSQRSGSSSNWSDRYVKLAHKNGKETSSGYVLWLIDVFSRYQWLLPLQRKKKSTHIARALIGRMYQEHKLPG